ncbi:PilZ domain protein [compost metagenome]
MHQFLLHPCDLPVELLVRKQTCFPRQSVHHISLGGVACNWSRGFRRGTPIEVHIPLFGDAARYPGVVAWSHKQAGDYLVGIGFIDEDSMFRARMVEQICQIEHYRRKRERELGTSLSTESTALEWISRNAADFPLFCTI